MLGSPMLLRPLPPDALTACYRSPSPFLGSLRAVERDSVVIAMVLSVHGSGSTIEACSILSTVGVLSISVMLSIAQVLTLRILSVVRHIHLLVSHVI